MNLKDQGALKAAMREVIVSQNLPVPEAIMIRTPFLGIRKTKGRCVYRMVKGKNAFGKTTENHKKYRISISTTRAKFTPHPTGKYKDKQGVRYSRSGEAMDKSEIIATAAHEIAHLKHFNHGADHTAYTKVVDRLLNNILGWV